MTYTKEYKESMQKYINSLLEKENNNMNSTTSLAGKSLFDTLKEQSERFNKWVNESEELLSGISTEHMDKEVSEEIFGKKNANLGRSLKEQLTEEYEKFAKWTSESQIILNLLKNVKETANTLNELDDEPVNLQKVTDDATTTQSAKCKYVYVETEENEFHFHDVKIESDDEYLTIYDKDSILKFRCQIDEIVNFMREE